MSKPASRWRQELERLTRRLATLKNKVSDLYELLGAGSEEDRAEIKAQINSASAERAAMQVEHDRVRTCVDAETFEVTPDQVREVLASFHQLLTDGAAGHLGQDVVHRAAAIFRMLVGGRIMVVVDKRAQRKTANVRGVFTPNLLRAVRDGLNDPRSAAEPSAAEVTVWLREPPQLDRLAPIVHELMDVQELSFRGAEKVLRGQGYKLNSGTVWQAYHRYYEMIGQPVPKRPYNNGHDRESA